MNAQKSEDELMQEARRVMQLELGRRQSPGDSLYPTSARAIEALRDSVRSMLHRLEQTEAAVDDEREALSNFLFTVYEHGDAPNALREADAILSFLAGFRRPVSPEPSADGDEIDPEICKGCDEYDPHTLCMVAAPEPQGEPTDAQVRVKRKIEAVQGILRAARGQIDDAERELANVLRAAAEEGKK